MEGSGANWSTGSGFQARPRNPRINKRKPNRLATVDKTCSGHDKEGDSMIVPRIALDHLTNPQTLATVS